MLSPPISDADGVHITGLFAGATTFTSIVYLDLKTCQPWINWGDILLRSMAVITHETTAITAEADTKQCVVIRKEKRIVVHACTHGHGHKPVLYGFFDVGDGFVCGNAPAELWYNVQAGFTQKKTADVVVVLLAIPAVSAKTFI
jgi:hypothetical protein